MRKIHYLIMLCLPLCLSIQAKAEPEGMLPAEKAEMKIIRKETGKIKKILSEEQFIKWRESLHKSRKK